MSDEPLTVDELRRVYRQRQGGRIRTDEHTLTDTEARTLRATIDTTEEQK